MKRARAVVDGNFGDSGKGLVTDWLCSMGAGMVIRFNGGANAGHTVVTPDGRRHVFSHFGSGTFLGVPTFLSHFVVVNPIAYFVELKKLTDLGLRPVLYADPRCLVTTFADMIINQHIEDNRDRRHGSTGMGINETIMRSDLERLKITMADLWSGVDLRPKLEEICTKYAEFRVGHHIRDSANMIERFTKECEAFAQMVHPLGIAQCADLDPVFEGAQGLLLDQDNKEFFPHVTRSKTGMHNVRLLCEQAGLDWIDRYYVSRTYLTRHGHGPLPNEDPSMSYPDDTNLEHPYQGSLRFAKLDHDALIKRCADDARSAAFKMVITHCDQLEPPADFARGNLFSHGPTREYVVSKRIAIH